MMMGVLDWASGPGADGEGVLCDHDWFNEEFPDDIPVAAMWETFLFLARAAASLQ